MYHVFYDPEQNNDDVSNGCCVQRTSWVHAFKICKQAITHTASKSLPRRRNCTPLTIGLYAATGLTVLTVVAMVSGCAVARVSGHVVCRQLTFGTVIARVWITCVQLLFTVLTCNNAITLYRCALWGLKHNNLPQQVAIYRPLKSNRLKPGFHSNAIACVACVA